MRIKKYRVSLKYAILFLAAAFLLVNGGFRLLVRNYIEYRKLYRQKAELERDRLRLGRELEDLKTAGRIERTARKELGLIRPDEIEYRFTPPSKTTDK